MWAAAAAAAAAAAQDETGDGRPADTTQTQTLLPDRPPQTQTAGNSTLGVIKSSDISD